MRVLHVIHDFLPRHRAGAELYAFRLAREQARTHRVSVLCAAYDPREAHGSLRWRVYEGLPVVELINNWAFDGFAETYRSPAINAVLDHVLRAVGPDVLHVHSLLGLSMDLPRLARGRGIPSVATLHDYTLVCPSGGQRVHVAEAHVCRAIDPERCARCFPMSAFQAQMAFAKVARRAGALGPAARLAVAIRRRFPAAAARAGRALARAAATPLAVEDIARRLGAAREVFETVDLFVAPSAMLAGEFRRLGLGPERLRVSGLGFVPLRVSRTPPPDGRVRIGFVGTLAWHKGVHVLVEALRELPPHRVELRIHGDPDTAPDYVAALRERARGLPVSFMGRFDDDGVAEVYGRLDVLVVPSLWPENSPLVIQEAFMAGVPVVAARIGGIPELVDDGRNGLLYEPFSPPALARALRTLIDEPERLRQLAEALPEPKSIEDDAREWDERYREVVEGAAAPARR